MLKQELVRNILEVRRVSDSLKGLKLEIEGNVLVSLPRRTVLAYWSNIPTVSTAGNRI